MLRSIRLRRLGVIEDAELELAPGLNVITGETGAGKTMVVTGLGLLLGARADPALVRTGADECVVEGDVDVAAQHPAARRVAEAGGEYEDGLVLLRTVSAQGRSRAHVGGRAAPIGVLGEVGEHLVAVHGQADQWRLREPEQHRLLLDSFGGDRVAAPLTAYSQAYAGWLEARAHLDDLLGSGAERTRQAQMLRSALEEIETVDPRVGEEDALRAEEERLAYADDLQAAALGGYAAISGGDDDAGQPRGSAVDLLVAASRALGTVSEHDPTLQRLRSRVDELSYLATDLAGELSSYAAGVESDPLRLAQVQQRRSHVSGLLRHYGGSTAEVLRWAEESARLLADLEVSQERIETVRAQVRLQHDILTEHGAALHEARVAAAAALSEQVSAELGHLAMGSARVQVVVTAREVTRAQQSDGVAGERMPAEGDLVELADRWCRPRPHGLDDVDILLAANPGSPGRTVAKAASGGELSRVMLALELVGAQRGSPVSTYVFDEVDAGVGGSAALDLGARLARLARTSQVLVVTHLGQVAAFADRHLAVRKSDDGQVSSSDVRVVEGPERVSEIARMLGGVQDSRVALEHAAELLHEHAPSRMDVAPTVSRR